MQRTQVAGVTFALLTVSVVGVPPVEAQSSSPPSVSITASDGDLSAGQVLAIGETATLTFTFSAAPRGFALDDVAVTPTAAGSLGSLQGSGATRTAVFTPASGYDGAASVSVTADSWTDGSGNAGADASLTLDVDTVRPTAVITGVPSNPSALSSTFTVTVDFDEPVVGFDSGGLAGERRDPAPVLRRGPGARDHRGPARPPPCMRRSAPRSNTRLAGWHVHAARSSPQASAGV